MNLIEKFAIIFTAICCSFSLYAERVVSLSPAVTELIIYSGGRELLCGRSSACTMPEAGHLPVAGDLGLPAVEAILKTRATVVISDIFHPQARWELLRRCGVRVEFLKNRRVEDLPDNIRQIGRVLSLPQAETAARMLQTQLQNLQQSCPPSTVRGIVIFGLSPLISCGEDTFVSGALRLAGVENAFGSAGKGYFAVSAEYLLAAAPEYIFIVGIPEAAVREFFQRGIFHRLPAVRDGRIIYLSADRWGRLTPALVAEIAALRKVIWQAQ